jgi:hypothetical protein
MSSKPKHSGGPKTNNGKAISSHNSTTHGLTARRWLNAEEQALFDETIEAFNNDFDPQTSIEKVLIVKMAECTVRLMRIQNTENAMFDLTSSEAGHPEESIKSLDNGSDRLSEAVGLASSMAWQFDLNAFVSKMTVLNEIDRQNIKDVVSWIYVEDNMPIVAYYVNKYCTKENLNLDDFISQETDQPAHQIIRIVKREDASYTKESLSYEEFIETTHKISPSSLQKYLNKLAFGLSENLQAQLVLKDIDHRTQQIKDAAMPDTQKLSLIQRYRTADERQFSKTLGELLKLREMLSDV